MAKKRSSNVAIGALIAAGIGYAAGVLTAPKSGKETRKDIHDAAVRAKAESEKKLKELYAELAKLVDTGKRTASKASSRAKKDIDSAVKRAQEAMDTAGDLLSAVREGEADNDELQKAIAEAKAATKHLKKYLSDAAANSSKKTD